MVKKKWIQDVKLKPGALHRQMHIPLDKKIPMYALDEVIETHIGKTAHIDHHLIKVTHLLKERAVFAKNARHFKHHKK